MTRSPAVIPRSAYYWLALVCVASGLPFGLFQKSARIHMGRLGVGLDDIGLLSLLALPWTLKFFWAPLVDRHGSRRTWLMGALATLTVVVLGYAFTCGGLPLRAGDAVSEAPGQGLPTIGWVLLGLLSVASSTLDVAADGFAIATFPGRAAGQASGLRVNAYRLAYLAAGGLLLGAVDVLSWQGVWFLAASILGALAISMLFLPEAPAVRTERRPVLEPFLELVRRPGFAVLAPFVLLFKVGDYSLTPMADQWLIAKDGAGWSNADLGTATTVGLIVTITGGFLGGWLTTRWGIFRALWILGALQALSNLAYAGAARIGGPVTPWVAAVVEPFCSGLGTAPFVALLMVSCNRLHAGTQFAILAALFGLAREVSGAFSGWGTMRLGWTTYFVVTFFLALPAFALLPWVKVWLARREAAEDAAPVLTTTLA